MLKNPPEQYTVGMILRQTEGSLTPVSIDDETSYERQSVTTRIWTRMEGAINEIVDGITLKDLVDWQMEQVGQYVI